MKMTKLKSTFGGGRMHFFFKLQIIWAQDSPLLKMNGRFHFILKKDMYAFVLISSQNKRLSSVIMIVMDFQRGKFKM